MLNTGSIGSDWNEASQLCMNKLSSLKSNPHTVGPDSIQMKIDVNFTDSGSGSQTIEHYHQRGIYNLDDFLTYNYNYNYGVDGWSMAMFYKAYIYGTQSYTQSTSLNTSKVTNYSTDYTTSHITYG